MFKVFGIQRTGTTYLRELLKQNFHLPVLTHELGWKHGEICDPSTQLERVKFKYGAERLEELRGIAASCKITAIIIIKNPYSWLQSMEAWGRKASKEQMSGSAAYFEAYNLLYKNHLWFIKAQRPIYCYKRVFFVQYEALLAQLGDTLQYIARKSEHQLKGIADAEWVEQSQPLTAEKRTFYLSPPKNDAIASLVDWETIEQFGYSR